MDDFLQVKYETLPGRTLDEKQESLEDIRAAAIDGKGLHLIYDRRVSPSRRPESENHLILWPGLVGCCARVSIINKDGSSQIVKDRSGNV